jgi:phospholipase C
VTAGHWQDTVFMLTWDDWGGWDDHVSTPNIEHTPDGCNWPTARGCRC